MQYLFKNFDFKKINFKKINFKIATFLFFFFLFLGSWIFVLLKDDFALAANDNVEVAFSMSPSIGLNIDDVILEIKITSPTTVTLNKQSGYLCQIPKGSLKFKVTFTPKYTGATFKYNNVTSCAENTEIQVELSNNTMISFTDVTRAEHTATFNITNIANVIINATTISDGSTVSKNIPGENEDLNCKFISGDTYSFDVMPEENYKWSRPPTLNEITGGTFQSVKKGNTYTFYINKTDDTVGPTSNITITLNGEVSSIFTSSNFSVKLVNSPDIKMVECSEGILVDTSDSPATCDIKTNAETTFTCNTDPTISGTYTITDTNEFTVDSSAPSDNKNEQATGTWSTTSRTRKGDVKVTVPEESFKADIVCSTGDITDTIADIPYNLLPPINVTANVKNSAITFSQNVSHTTSNSPFSAVSNFEPSQNKDATLNATLNPAIAANSSQIFDINNIQSLMGKVTRKITEYTSETLPDTLNVSIAEKNSAIQFNDQLDSNKVHTNPTYDEVDNGVNTKKMLSVGSGNFAAPSSTKLTKSDVTSSKIPMGTIATKVSYSIKGTVYQNLEEKNSNSNFTMENNDKIKYLWIEKSSTATNDYDLSNINWNISEATNGASGKAAQVDEITQDVASGYRVFKISNVTDNCVIIFETDLEVAINFEFENSNITSVNAGLTCKYEYGDSSPESFSKSLPLDKITVINKENTFFIQFTENGSSLFDISEITLKESSNQTILETFTNDAIRPFKLENTLLIDKEKTTLIIGGDKKYTITVDNNSETSHLYLCVEGENNELSSSKNFSYMNTAVIEITATGDYILPTTSSSVVTVLPTNDVTYKFISTNPNKWKIFIKDMRQDYTITAKTLPTKQVYIRHLTSIGSKGATISYAGINSSDNLVDIGLEQTFSLTFNNNVNIDSVAVSLIEIDNNGQLSYSPLHSGGPDNDKTGPYNFKAEKNVYGVLTTESEAGSYIVTFETDPPGLIGDAITSVNVSTGATINSRQLSFECPPKIEPTFTVSLSPKYNLSRPVATIDGILLASELSNGVIIYKCRQICMNKTIVLSGFSANKYTIHFVGDNINWPELKDGNGKTIKDEDVLLEHGKAYTVNFTPVTGYDIQTLFPKIKRADDTNPTYMPIANTNVSKTNSVNTEFDFNQFSDPAKFMIKNISENLEIDFSIMEFKEYTVDFLEYGASTTTPKFSTTIYRNESFNSILNMSTKVGNRLKLTHAQKFYIAVTPNSRYNQSKISPIVQIADKGKIKELNSPNAGEFRYEVQVTGDNIIYFNNIFLNQYKVNLPQAPDVLNTMDFYNYNQTTLLTEEDARVYHDEDFSFRIKPKEGYHANEVIIPIEIFAIDSTIISYIVGTPDNDYYRYVIEKVTGEVYILPSEPLPKKKYKISFEGNNVEFYDMNNKEIKYDDSGNLINEATVEAEFSTSYSFQVKAASGYNVDKMLIMTDNGLTLNETTIAGNPVIGAKGYIINKVLEHTKIIVSGIQRNEYEVTFKRALIETPRTAFDRKNITELVKIYDKSGNLSKEINDSQEPDIKYLKNYATDGDDYEFKIVLNDPYTQSNISTNCKIGNNDPIILNKSENSEYFVIPRVKVVEDNGAKSGITITISGIAVNQYAVSFNGEGINIFNDDDTNLKNISSWDDVNKKQQENEENKLTIGYFGETGGDVRFRVAANTDLGYYIDSELDVTASNGVVNFQEEKTDLDVHYRIYLLSAVSNDTVVSVESIKSTLYLVKFDGDANNNGINNESKNVDTTGFKIINDGDWNITAGVRVSCGTSIKFKVVLDDKYSKSTIKVVKYGENIQLAKDPVLTDYYILNEVIGDCTVKITDIKVNQYNVTLPPDNIDYNRFYYTDLTDSPLDKIQENVVLYDGTYVFYVRTNHGYNLSNAMAAATNSSAFITEPSADKIKVAVAGVRGDVEVTISNIAPNLYTIKFEDETGIELTHADVINYNGGRNITKGTTAYYKNELDFTVELAEGYTLSKISVEIQGNDNNTIIPASIDSTNNNKPYYNISEVLNDMEIIISGIELNEYNISLVPNAEDATALNSKFYKPSVVVESREQLVGTLSKAVKHGSTYEFLVVADEGYIINYIDVTTKNADVVIDKNSNIEVLITLKNVENDLIVNVSNVVKKTFYIQFNSSTTANVEILDNNTLRNIKSSPNEVLFEENYSFQVIPNHGYEQSFLTLKVVNPKNETNTLPANYITKEVVEGGAKIIWTFHTITENVNLSLREVNLNIYEVNFLGNDVEFMDSITNETFYPMIDDIEIDTPQRVNHGSDFKFKVTPKTGYDLSKMVINATVGKLEENLKNDIVAVYTLKNITDTTTISVSVNPHIVDIKIIAGEGFDFQNYNATSNISGFQTINYGNDFVFAIRPWKGYDISTLKSFVEGYEIPDEYNGFIDKTHEDEGYYVFTASNVTADVRITATIRKEKYRVMIPVVTGARFYENEVEVTNADELIVEYGDRFKFEVALEIPYNQSTPIVKANGNVLALISGYYTIVDIDCPIDITVDDVVHNKYKINLVENIGADYTDINNGGDIISGLHLVEHGGKFTFGVAVRKGFDISQMVVIVKNEDGTSSSLTPTYGGKYIISNIENDKTITLTDVNDAEYKLTFKPADGVTYYTELGVIINEPVTIIHGKNFEFTITIADEYDDSIPFVYSSVTKSELNKLSSGKYIVKDITSDVDVSVLNVIKNKYAVILKKTVGMSYLDEYKNVISGEQMIRHGEPFNFYIRLNSLYSDSKYTVMMGKETLEPDDDNMFTIPVIVESKTLTVIGVELNEEVILANDVANTKIEVENESEADFVIELTKRYNNLSEIPKNRFDDSAMKELSKLQEKTGKFYHTVNNVIVEGVNWHTQLFAKQINYQTDVYSRIYGKLKEEFILSLYDISLYDALAGENFSVPENQKVKISIPTPDLTHFSSPLIIHETADGKIEYLVMEINGDRTAFETTSFSPMGVAAKKNPNSGYTSFFETLGFDFNAYNDVINNEASRYSSGDESKTDTSKINLSVSEVEENTDKNVDVSSSGKTENETLPASKDSAVRILITMLAGLAISITVTIIFRKRKKIGKINKNA